MKTDYTVFDDALIAKIGGGAATFAAIQGGALGLVADGLAGKHRDGAAQGWRLIDRRLQALRKAGRLAYDRRTGWRVA